MLKKSIRRYAGWVLLLLLASFLTGCTGVGVPSVNIPDIPVVPVGPTIGPVPTPTSSSSPGSTTTVSGHVFSSTSGRSLKAPLGGARVYLLDRLLNTITDYQNTATDGSFELRNVTTGYKWLFITKTGFQVVRQAIVVQSGDNPQGNFTAVPGNNPEISCAILDFSDGSSVSAPLKVFGVNFQPATGAPVVRLDGSALDIINDQWDTYHIKCTWPSWSLSGILVVQAGGLSSPPYSFSPYSPDYPTDSPSPTPTSTPTPTPTSSSTPTPAPTPTSSPITSQKQWTILFYLDGDNDLESYALNDFNEMEQVGSSGEVNILIQLDRSSDYRHCRRYYVTADQDVYNITSPVLQDLGNVDMGKVQSLTDFVSYGASHYPAEHYAIILWNHGSGWKSKALSSAVPKAICYDDHGTEMSIADLKDAVTQIKSTLGKNIDILGFDACLMQLFEVAWGMKDAADYVLGSEESIPSSGWVYNTTVSRLVANPSMTSGQIANYFVDDYFSETSSEGITLSSLATSQAAAVMSSLNSFSQVLTQKMSTYRDTLQNIDLYQTQYYDYSDYSDLYDFALKVNMGIPDAQVQSAAQSLMNSIAAFVVHERHSQYRVGNSHGLAIWLPGRAQYNSQKDDYSTKLSFFTSASSWDEFLEALWAP
ncbi:MAG: clostripain-related cysteine peptidase [bacterium]